MQIKTDNIEFVSFSDGICNIYTEDDEGNKIYKYNNIAYSNRVLGVKRYWAAKANQMDVNRVIRIPLVNNIDTYDSIETEDGSSYNIKMLQIIYNSNPPCRDLTLQKV